MAEPASYLLYGLPFCPYCLKVRIVLWWMGRKVPWIHIDRDREHAMLLVRQGGRLQVPCLRIHQDSGADRWLYESSAIIDQLRTGAGYEI